MSEILTQAKNQIEYIAQVFTPTVVLILISLFFITVREKIKK